MADHLGSYNASGSRTTVRFSFTTHAASGAPVAPNSAFEAADLRIYKDGSATQRSSANGITMTSPFDSVTGLHHVDIDLTDNTDAGFYAAGSFYEVHLVPDETVDSLAVVKVLAYFEIGPPQVNVVQISGDATAADNLELQYDGTGLSGNTFPATQLQATTIDDFLDTEIAAILAAVDTEVASILAAVDTEITDIKTKTDNLPLNTDSVLSTMQGGITDILADTNELQTDWTDGGRLDLILDATGSAGDPWVTLLPGAYGAGSAGKIVGDNLNATVSSRASQTSVDTIDDFLDTEIASILAAVDTEVASILAAVDTEIAAILADTNELQTDWADGGRLDLILDARASQASVNTIDDFIDTEIAAILAAVDTEIATLLTSVNTIDDFLDTEIAAILAAVDTEVAAILVSTARFETMIELDGAVYRYTTNALEQSPAGGGAATIEIQRNTDYGPFAFLMVDSNGNLLDDLTVNCSVMIDGAAYVPTTNPTATFVSGGTYYVNLVAADLNGKDIVFRAEATGAVSVYMKFVTQG